MSATFAELGVPAFIVNALAQQGITTPFDIQAATIADSLAGRDVIGRAPTGSGKTVAFGVPIVAQVAELGKAAPGAPLALILSPTRELADQITEELAGFSGSVRVDAVYGGVGYGKQVAALKRGVDVLVACPGRLEDLLERRDLTLKSVQLVVLDEADRMADMGFMPAVKRLLDQARMRRQTLMFSATLDGEIGKLSKQYQTDPVRHEVGPARPDIRNSTHTFWTADRAARNPIVVDTIKAAWPAIVFVRTRHGADRLVRQLNREGLSASALHGGMSQPQRTRSLAAFSENRTHALVATDVAARGIHVDGVATVIHYDPPEDDSTYVHRSGRTARAGAEGFVLSLIDAQQKRDAQKMIRNLELDTEITAPNVAAIPSVSLAGERALAPAPRVEAAPTRSNSGPPSNRGRSATAGRGNRSVRAERDRANDRRRESGTARGVKRVDRDGNEIRTDRRDDRRDDRRADAGRDDRRDQKPRRGPAKSTASAGSARRGPSARNERSGGPSSSPSATNRKQRRAHLQGPR